MCLFFTVPWVCLQCVIVIFSGHTHLKIQLQMINCHIFVRSDKRRVSRCGLTGNKTVTIYFTDTRTIIEIPIEEIQGL